MDVHTRDATPTLLTDKSTVPIDTQPCESVADPNNLAPVVDSKPIRVSEHQTVNSRPQRDIKEPAYLKDYVRH
jgi:hypothetical protein